MEAFFALPGDTAASSRYWERDIIAPEVAVINGRIRVPEQPGMGYGVNRAQVQRYLVTEKQFLAKHL